MLLSLGRSRTSGDYAAMSTLPIRLTASPSHTSPRTRVSSPHTYWFPVLGALIFICFTSTTLMGGHNTGLVVAAVWRALFGTSHIKLAWEVNFIGRKIGHFFGYGIVGLIFRNAWYKTSGAFSLVAKSWLYPFSSFLAVVSTFAVASMDEYHQMFLPGRVGSLHDALLDASGALFLNFVFLAGVINKRRRGRNESIVLPLLREDKVVIHSGLRRAA
jgi:VanZ family protein